MSIGVPVESSFRWRQSGPQIRFFDCFRLIISHILNLHGHAEHPGPVQAGPGRRHHLRNSFPDRPGGLHRVPGGDRQLQSRLRELCSPAAVLCLGADELDPGAVRRRAVLRVPERGHVLQRHGCPGLRPHETKLLRTCKPPQVRIYN